MLPSKVFELARNQHGVVSRSQAIGLGVSRRRWDNACRSGVISVVAPGVGLCAGAPGGEYQDIMTAVLSAGRSAVASHRTAARLWGIARFADGPIDVSIARRAVLIPRPGVVIHRPTDIVELRGEPRHGIPCAGPLRILLDLGAVAPWAVPMALEHFIVGEQVTSGAVRAAIDRHSRPGRHGIRAIRQALDNWVDAERPSESVLEARMTQLLAEHGLSGWAPQVQIGRYRVDFAHHESRTVLEVDGWAFHGSRQAFDSDRLRDTELAQLGWQVVRATWPQVTSASTSLAARLRAIIQSRSALRLG